MTTTDTGPPSIPIPNYPTGYPSPTRKLGKAWAAAWAEMEAAGTEPLDGVEMAARVAGPQGLAATTMVSLFTRAATAGVLVREHKKVPTGRGPRSRTFYRIPCVECAEYKGTGGEDVTCATCGKPGVI